MAIDYKEEKVSRVELELLAIALYESNARFIEATAEQAYTAWHLASEELRASWRQQATVLMADRPGPLDDLGDFDPTTGTFPSPNDPQDD